MCSIERVLSVRRSAMRADVSTESEDIVGLVNWAWVGILATDLRLTFGFFSFTVTGSHSIDSSIVSTIMLIIQFKFFFLTLGLETCVEQVSVEALRDLDSSDRVSLVFFSRVLSIIFSGIDCFTLRFCQNIATVSWKAVEGLWTAKLKMPLCYATAIWKSIQVSPRHLSFKEQFICQTINCKCCQSRWSRPAVCGYNYGRDGHKNQPHVLCRLLSRHLAWSIHKERNTVKAFFEFSDSKFVKPTQQAGYCSF